MTDDTHRTDTTLIPAGVPSHFDCDICGTRTRAVSQQQRFRASTNESMQCARCYKAKKDVERREDALVSTAAMSIPDMAGEFPISFAAGGFVYQLTDIDNDPLYVGSTSRDLFTRPFEHKNRDWWDSVATVQFWYYPTTDQVRVAEHALIAAVQPRFNSHYVGTRI